MNKRIFIQRLIFLLLGNLIQGKLTDVVFTDKGPVQGERVRTAQNSSFEYSAFRGIPYAKPPIGELRFQPPVEHDAWSHILITTKEASICPQIVVLSDKYDGDENCLYLNVYSPKISFDVDNNELLAVMVWIHSGTFIAGESNSRTYGPDFLITGNVVIVAMNYRVGGLGFLSLDIPEATGNMGLKDQVLGLKWIKKNIKKFGGDPNKVTIFGQSAGAVCVLLHQLSPASEGLFRGAIAMSGSPLNHWAFDSISSAVAHSINFGKSLGIDTDDKKELIDFLRTVSAEELVFATNNETGVRLGATSFKPTYENPIIAKDIFLPECSLKRYKSGNFSKIPSIIGFTNAESLAIISVLNDLFPKIESAREFLNSLNLNNSKISRAVDNMIANLEIGIKDLSKDLIFSSVNITTDIIFIAGIDLTQKYLSENSSVYYYRNSFDYKKSRHRISGADVEGTAHADDMALIFWQPIINQTVKQPDRVIEQRKRMVKLWTNFAKYSNPTPDGMSDTELNVTWAPSGTSGLHLEIGNDGLKMGPRPTDFTVKILQLITKPLEGYFTGCPLFEFPNFF